MSEPIFTTDCVVIGSDPAGEIEATEADWVKRIYSFIGDTSFDVKVLQKSRWQLNCNVAEHYSKGRVFCLGDAVHRHTPGGGLRSNTSIQDSYNLAWKIAHVLKGLAGPALLETYSVERQPIGAFVVKRAMQVVNYHAAVWDVLRVTKPGIQSLRDRIQELSEASSKRRKLREEFRKATFSTRFEHCGIGIELNQHYESTANPF